MATKSTPRPKAPGKNIEEWQRKGLKIQFRLPENAAKELQRRANGRGTTPNALALIYIFDLLRAAEHQGMTEDNPLVELWRIELEGGARNAIRMAWIHGEDAAIAMAASCIANGVDETYVKDVLAELRARDVQGNDK